ncbi:hypothetical protein SADUNF_Sadunf05G0124300 [Salix dunnii]|uniref:BPL/LPL catalytic domain-containing protein n=1 Tax=Salix dunnii TaxID=1413687 RepID=A0A835K829_9ROSI|nr:hypothetical protein SADUNF_Sadunf05G0124300 [Salix dunnii]
MTLFPTIVSGFQLLLFALLVFNIKGEVCDKIIRMSCCCLVFSFTIQMEDGRVVPLLQYVVSLAVTGAAQDPCGQNCLPHIYVRIKLSSDLYLNGIKKVGGILCTSTYRSEKFNVSAGTYVSSSFICEWQRVIIQEKNENQVVERMWSPFSHLSPLGLTSSGYLLAIGEDNQMCELHRDGNRYIGATFQNIYSCL